MNLSSVKTMNYEQITMNNANKIQTQSNPIFTNFCQIFTIFYSFFSRSSQKTCAFGTNFLTKSQKTSQEQTFLAVGRNWRYNINSAVEDF